MIENDETGQCETILDEHYCSSLSVNVRCILRVTCSITSEGRKRRQLEADYWTFLLVTGGGRKPLGTFARPGACPVRHPGSQSSLSLAEGPYFERPVAFRSIPTTTSTPGAKGVSTRPVHQLQSHLDPLYSPRSTAGSTCRGHRDPALVWQRPIGQSGKASLFPQMQIPQRGFRCRGP